MTIIARFDTLTDAYEGMEALRSNAIPPGLQQNGKHLELSVDDDFAENAKSVLQKNPRFMNPQCSLVAYRNDGPKWSDFEEQNI